MHDARGFAAELAVDHRSPWDKGGDLDLIQHVLRTFAEYADEALVTKMNEFQLGSLSVVDEAATVSPLLEFPQGRWRSDPEREAMIDAPAVGHLRLPRQSWVL